MTIPEERSRAVIYARRFLLDLLDPKKTPRVPKAIRQQAGRVLRHYPSEFDINRAVKGDVENVFSKVDYPEDL